MVSSIMVYATLLILFSFKTLYVSRSLYLDFTLPKIHQFHNILLKTELHMVKRF